MARPGTELCPMCAQPQKHGAATVQAGCKSELFMTFPDKSYGCETLIVFSSDRRTDDASLSYVLPLPSVEIVLFIFPPPISGEKKAHSHRSLGPLLTIRWDNPSVSLCQCLWDDSNLFRLKVCLQCRLGHSLLQTKAIKMR